MEQDEQLSTLLKWSTDELRILENNLGFLKEIRSDNITSVLVDFLLKCPLGRHTQEKEILRCRPNDVDNTGSYKDFTKVSELSYNKVCPEKIRMGRFNYDGEPMFYGTISNNSEHSTPELTAAIESYPDMIKGDGFFGYKDFTYSIWKVKKPFELFTLTFDQEIKNPDRKLHDESIGNIKSVSDNAISEILFGFWEFISRICSNNSNSPLDYVLSNLLLKSINQCLYEDLPKLKGLVYPSSRTDRMGTNIVLYPDTVDEYLKIDRVVVLRVHRIPNSKEYTFEQRCDVTKIEGDEFSIKRYL